MGSQEQVGKRRTEERGSETSPITKDRESIINTKRVDQQRASDTTMPRNRLKTEKEYKVVPRPEIELRAQHPHTKVSLRSGAHGLSTVSGGLTRITE